MHATESSGQIPFALIATVPAWKLSRANGTIEFSSCYNLIVYKITLTKAQICSYIRYFQLQLTLSVIIGGLFSRFSRNLLRILGLAGDFERELSLSLLRS